MKAKTRASGSPIMKASDGADQRDLRRTQSAEIDVDSDGCVNLDLWISGISISVPINRGVDASCRPREAGWLQGSPLVASFDPNGDRAFEITHQLR